MSKNIGIGSFFYKINEQELPSFEFNSIIPNSKLFYTGRHAIKYLLNYILLEKKIETIWLPNYYCQHVTAWLKENFDLIKFYDIDPFAQGKSFDVLKFSKPNDIVILNNYWGIFEFTVPKNKNRPIIIEDHSHGWLSKSCLNSNADYCFASLRKTIPIPLGGILWKPNGDDISHIDSLYNSNDDFYKVWELIDNAMRLKTNFNIKNDPNITKDKYLEDIATAENFLHHQYDVIQLKEEHSDYIQIFLQKDYASCKIKNLNNIKPLIINNNNFKIIEQLNTFTFGLNLVFTNRDLFNNLKSHLVKNDIYPSELWPDNKISLEYKYLLNIHIDYRYNSNDMNYISMKINEWITKIPNKIV